MSETLRRVMRKNLPLLTVQIFLAALNLTINQMNGGTTFWAIYPILGMAIPQVITIGQALLGESDAAQGVREKVRVDAVKADAIKHQYADQVRRYQEELEHRALLIESTTRSERLNVLAEQFGGWADKVEAMEEQVRLLKGDALVQNDLHTVTESLQTLQERILGESDAGVRRSLEQAATARRTQLAALEKLAATTRHAEAQLEAPVGVRRCEVGVRGRVEVARRHRERRVEVRQPCLDGGHDIVGSVLRSDERWVEQGAARSTSCGWPPRGLWQWFRKWPLARATWCWRTAHSSVPPSPSLRT
jgi:hypothetical protein